MPRNSPWEAVDRYLEPFRAALGCVKHGTLITTAERSYAPGRVHSLVINGGDLLELRQRPIIALSGGQRFRIVEDDAIEDGPYRVHTVEYFYAFSTADEHEILNFQWTPEAPLPAPEDDWPAPKTFPHLHIGRGLLGSNAPVFPDDFHKKHIPTGRVSFESIIRFAIEELEVPPLREDWPDILDQGQAQFNQYRRPPSF